MRNRPPEIREVEVDALEAALTRMKSLMSEEDYAILQGAIRMLVWLMGELEAAETTVADLRNLVFGPKSEKRENLAKGEDAKGEGAGKGRGKARNGTKPESKEKPKGHGKNGAKDYRGATTIRVKHESLATGQCCPACGQGKVYLLPEPHRSVRIFGQAPIMAQVAEAEALRCNLCGEVFEAKLPPEFDKKYDATARSMMANFKYGTGFPFNRLEKFEGNLGIPLPATTQWGVVRDLAQEIAPAHRELVRQAAQGEVLQNDDTKMRVLELGSCELEDPDLDAGDAQEDDDEPGNERTGVFTTGIVSRLGDQQIALFMTGRQHAGENLEDVLEERQPDLPPPTQMCDALSRNIPKGFKTVLANCLAHGRRKFVKLVDAFPEECLHVIDELCLVYEVDGRAKEERLSPEERLRLHQAESKPVMDRLEEYLKAQIASKKVEPNSRLGKAIKYMIRHWGPLSLFLRVPGAPVDNNLCEQGLKLAILNRKNAYFYKTMNGARVGDLFMSLIQTAELAGANPVDYLTQLQLHSLELESDPAAWMPWNYRETLDRLACSNRSRASPKDGSVHLDESDLDLNDLRG